MCIPAWGTYTCGYNGRVRYGLKVRSVRHFNENRIISNHPSQQPIQSPVLSEKFPSWTSETFKATPFQRIRKYFSHKKRPSFYSFWCAIRELLKNRCSGATKFWTVELFVRKEHSRTKHFSSFGPNARVTIWVCEKIAQR
jgi:hypothetical protein